MLLSQQATLRVYSSYVSEHTDDQHVCFALTTYHVWQHSALPFPINVYQLFICKQLSSQLPLLTLSVLCRPFAAL
jgi:hypothetical protein